MNSDTDCVVNSICYMAKILGDRMFTRNDGFHIKVNGVSEKAFFRTIWKIAIAIWSADLSLTKVLPQLKQDLGVA